MRRHPSANDELHALVNAGARRLATRGADAAASELSWPCLLMRIGSRWCGLRAESVTEVVAAESITRVPAQPRHILGVSLVHGRLVPVVDLGELMVGMEMTLEVTSGRRLVVVAHNDIEIGIAADDAKGVIYLPALIQGQQDAARPELVSGEVRWQQHLVCLLDEQSLVRIATGA